MRAASLSLVEYQRARGPESPMTPLVTALSDGDLRNLAAHYPALAAWMESRR